jgi:hypothetical protein
LGERNYLAAKLTNAIIEAAIDGFEAQKQRIDVQIAELRALLTGAREASVEEAPAIPKRRKISPEGLKRMREGQKRRWAKVKGRIKSPAKKASAETSKPKKTA